MDTRSDRSGTSPEEVKLDDGEKRQNTRESRDGAAWLAVLDEDSSEVGWHC